MVKWLNYTVKCFKLIPFPNLHIILKMTNSNAKSYSLIQLAII